MSNHYKLARTTLAAAALASLAACANLAQVAPGTPLADVQAPVSYTHLDVYKRQAVALHDGPPAC